MTQRITPRYMHIAGAAIIALEQGTTDQPTNVEAVERKLTVVPYYWNPDTLAYEVARQTSTATGGGSTGGTASTAVDATLTSGGSTRLVGQVTIGNPTTSVSLSSQHTVTADLSSAGSTRQLGLVGLLAGSSANVLGAVAQGAGSTSVAPWYVISTASAGAGSTAVDATLTSAGSTRLVGTVSVTGSTANTMGAVALVAGTSANTLGSVALVAGTSANTLGSVAMVAGTSATLLGGVVINSGTTAITLGAAALLAGSSANTIGNVAQGAGGSSANAWMSDGFSYSSANTSRTSVSTTVDIAVVGANANRKGLIIANLSTAQTVALGMSTAAVTTGLANASMYLQPASQLTWGYGGGGFPNFTGNIRGINITSTVLGGGVAVTQFTNT